MLHGQYERVTRQLSEGDESWRAFFLELRDELSCRTMERFEGLKIIGGSSSPIDDEPASLHRVAAANKLASSGLSSLKDLDGKAQTDSDKIASIVERHFTSLYGHTDECLPAATFLDSIQERLNEEEANKLQEPFSLTEIWTAVDSVEDGKASGVDGLPAELYRKLRPKIKLSLQAVLNELRESGALPKSMREGSITLIPKSGDKSMIMNWRPITLLCSDN